MCDNFERSRFLVGRVSRCSSPTMMSDLRKGVISHRFTETFFKVANGLQVRESPNVRWQS